MDEHGFGRELDNWEQNWDILHTAGAKLQRPLFIQNAISVITSQPFHLEDMKEAGRMLMAQHAALRAKVLVDKHRGRIRRRWAETHHEPGKTTDTHSETAEENQRRRRRRD